ncbi:MAG: GNAT family N-acetyltransferase [Candidatus Paceibacterota bacterium]|jgi:GNAT superfamily N-acetyltransferase
MELPKIEKRETPEFSCKTITAKELLDRIYQGKSLPQDSRFLPKESGGAFKYFNLREVGGFLGDRLDNKFYPIAEINGEIAGMAELEEDPRREKNFWIKFVSVDEKYQGQSCATKLISEIFQFAKDNEHSLEESFYSDEGEQKLKKLVRESAEKSGVELILHK